MPNPKVLFKFGTAAQYAALENKLDNALYFLLDTNELYRGTVPFGQAHVYTGSRAAGITDANAIAAIVNDEPVIQGDIVVLHNSDNTSDAFVYSADEDEWLKIGNSSYDTIITRLAALEGTVADLDAALNGTAADPEQGIEAQAGLIDRVADLETGLASLSAAAAGAFHFKGATEDLALIENPAEGDVYQVGTSEYAWNGQNWIELGTPYDLSNYVTQSQLNTEVADLEALIGHAASTHQEEDEEGNPITVEIPATGIYADLANHADQIIPLFNGVISGLVPVDDAALSDNVKATHFLNALGNWVTVSTSGGQTTYTDPEGNTYNTVEDYVTYMIQNHVEALEYVWESIDGNE